MNGKKTIIILIIAAIIVIFINNIRCYNKSDLVGVYVNNYNEKIHDNYLCYALEMPNKKDTLILYENNRYRGNYMGTGSYKLYKDNFYTLRISLSRDDKSEGWELLIDNKPLYGGVPKIPYSFNCDLYYRKINHKTP